MARFEVDIFEKCVTVDLHKYSHRTALIVAREKIREAYGHGFRHVKLIHGAADITKKNDGGSINGWTKKNVSSGKVHLYSGSRKTRCLQGGIGKKYLLMNIDSGFKRVFIFI
jgi:DNA-nicking Smr family endonuclease